MTTRVVVIGAGIAGAAAAHRLVDSCEVVLVEMESQAGYHATGRSAATLSETSGSPAVCALAAASRPFFVDPPDESFGGGLLRPRGLLWVADEEWHGALDDLGAVAASIDVRAERLDARAAAEIVPALRPEWVAGALHEPDAMSIDVARLLDGFLTSFRHKGGTVRLATPTIAAEFVGSTWRVRVTDSPTGNDDTIECDAVVDAGGAWADDLARRSGVTPIGLRPLRRTAFLFPVDGAERWPLVMDVGSRFYFEPEGPGLLASPAEETLVEPCDAQADELAMAQATDALAEATTLRVRGVRSSWAGLRTFTPDRVPVVGPDPDHPGWFWLAGQGGAGIKTAPAMAEALAALVLGEAFPTSLTDLGLTAEHLAADRFRR
ncbi:MAG: NAD(P)/FAD-dependent oxidoreductase [Ilumatobacteraceae bacterium]